MSHDTGTGNAAVAGIVQTGFTTPRIRISHLHGRPSVQFITRGSRANWPARMAAGGVQRDALSIYSARSSGDNADSQLTLFRGARGWRLGTIKRGRPFISGGNPNSETEDIFFGIYGGGPWGSLDRRPAFSGNGRGDQWGIGHSQKYLTADGSHMRMINNDGTLWLSGEVGVLMGGNWQFSTIQSTSGGNLLAMGSGGRILVRSSSARIKNNIEPLDIDPGLSLRLADSQWTDAFEEEQVGGLVAEQAESAGMPPRLLRYDSENRVNGIHDQWPVVMLSTLRDHEARLAALEARMTGGGE